MISTESIKYNKSVSSDTKCEQKYFNNSAIFPDTLINAQNEDGNILIIIIVPLFPIIEEIHSIASHV